MSYEYGKRTRRRAYEQGDKHIDPGNDIMSI